MKLKILKGILSLLCVMTLMPASAQVFYKIEGNGLGQPSYLFGSHHLAPADFPERIKSLPAAMEQTEAVVGEIDMTGNPMQMQMEMAKYMVAPEDSILSKLVTAEEYAKLNEQFRPLSPMPGMELSMLDGMRPMVPMTMATLTLVAKSMPDFDPNNQLDASFQKLYKEGGKKVIPLETIDQQAELLYCS
ncbi:MAG: TraB/GumN family protein, partial [Muribaculaceae bacterium]|nr:TraB/GumN family protein [Muribaculaceae bacterium]